MLTSNEIDEIGEEMVRRKLIDISKSPNGAFTWRVKDFDEKTDRRLGNSRCDLEVWPKSNSESYHFRVQVKSSFANFPTIRLSHIEDWLDCAIPTIIVVHLIEKQETYWVSPQLLVAERGGLPDKQETWALSRVDYKNLDSSEFPTLVSQVKQVFSLQKKTEAVNCVHPGLYKDFSRHLLQIDYSVFQQLLLKYIAKDKSRVAKQILKYSYIPNLFNSLLSLHCSDDFITFGTKLFTTTFMHFFEGFGETAVSKQLGEILGAWLRRVYELSLNTRLTPYSYYTLESILSYNKPGDWLFKKLPCVHK